MFEKDNSTPPLSFFELERQARIERNRMIQAGVRMAAEATAKGLRMLVLRGKRRAQAFAPNALPSPKLTSGSLRH